MSHTECPNLAVMPTYTIIMTNSALLADRVRFIDALQKALLHLHQHRSPLGRLHLS